MLVCPSLFLLRSLYLIPLTPPKLPKSSCFVWRAREKRRGAAGGAIELLPAGFGAVYGGDFLRGLKERLREIRVMLMKVEGQKDMATKKRDKNNVNLRKRKEVFIYGNYKKYYGYRLHNMEEDPRLQVFKREWFENKDCLDIGCNQGLVTITIAKKFFCRSIVGIDIDKGLIDDAKCNLRNTARKKQSQDILVKCSFPEGLNSGAFYEHTVSQSSNEEFLYTQCHPSLSREHDLLQVVSFHCENFVENMNVCPEKFHTILCLSVTKWIHLNWGDSGLLLLFSKIWRLLKPGGVLLLESQPWASYKRYRQLSEATRTNYSNIHLHPDQFRDILLDKVGFRYADTITDKLSGTVAGFDRPIMAFIK